MSSSIHSRPSDPQSRVGIGGQSPSATILDTLKKKMSVLKDELETTKDEIDRSHHQLDEERRRRECVRSAGHASNTQKNKNKKPESWHVVHSGLKLKLFRLYLRLNLKCLPCKDAYSCWKKIWNVLKHVWPKQHQSWMKHRKQLMKVKGIQKNRKRRRKKTEKNVGFHRQSES